MTGIGQQLDCAIHEAVAKNTELDVSCWIYGRAPISRQTCAHAAQRLSPVPPIVHTKDGRWFMLMTGRATKNLQSFAAQYGVTSEFLNEDASQEYGKRAIPGSTSPKDPGSMSERQVQMIEVMQRVIGQFTYEEAPWHEAQEAGLLFAPLRAPEDNLEDDHWKVRGTFSEIDHPEHQRAFSYVTSKWISSETSWKGGRRAPLLNEDEASVLSELSIGRVKTADKNVAASPRRNSPRGKPLALDGVRIFDFSWFLASAGGTRFLASMGAEVIKVEWAGHPDTRMGAMAPVGGREARRTATAPLEPVSDSDMGFRSTWRIPMGWRSHVVSWLCPMS
jgi:crotonobetainyl-CoA:carnitine CoA-transferase CaiB-like acyl-CoA transferase